MLLLVFSKVRYLSLSKLILVLYFYVEKSKDKKLNYVILLTPSVSEEAQPLRKRSV
jgi:hypothetical protein